VSRCGFRGWRPPSGTVTASHDTRLRGTMYSGTSLLFLGAAALLGTTAPPAHAAWAHTPCGDTRVGWDPECCYYGYCSSSRQCWVTETGIGVCVPVRYDRAEPRYRRVNERRR
jgi:hypothetical protein